MSVNVYNKDTQTLTEVAGTGTVEFGASTVRKVSVAYSVAGNSVSRHTVTFSSPMPDADYEIAFPTHHVSNSHITYQIMDKSANGFSLYVTNPYGSTLTDTVDITAFKLHTVEGLEELETAVAGLKPSSPVLLEKTSISGLTTAWRDNLVTAHCAYRVGNLVIMNISMTVNGTYPGESGWFNLWDMPTSLLNSGESFVPPYFSYIVKYPDGTLGDIMNGQTKYLTSGQEYGLNIQGQIVLIIV